MTLCPDHSLVIELFSLVNITVFALVENPLSSAFISLSFFNSLLLWQWLLSVRMGTFAKKFPGSLLLKLHICLMAFPFSRGHLLHLFIVTVLNLLISIPASLRSYSIAFSIVFSLTAISFLYFLVNYRGSPSSCILLRKTKVALSVLLRA